MSNTELPIHVGEVIGGKYRVERVVGSGGMSIVVLAWHLELEQNVALKILHGAGVDFGDAAERFRREARAAARIRSEHVARVLDVGTLDNGAAYMVLEYLEGNDLAEELAKRGPLPIEEIVRYVLEALEALAEAHAVGIVHRDLKPENLFIATRPDGTRSIKVLDFGISKSLLATSIADLALTKTSSFVGSPLYMSPEQMRSSRSVDHRADIWSLGAILYEAVAGRVPYFADSIGELCALLLQEMPPPIGNLRAGVPAPFEAVVLKCLEKDRERRYSSVAELATALLPFAPGAGLHAERVHRVLTLAGAVAMPITMIPDALPKERTGRSRPVLQSSPGANRFTPVTPEPTMAAFSKTDMSGLRTRKMPMVAFAVLALVGLGWALRAALHDADANAAASAAPIGLSTRVGAGRTEAEATPKPPLVAPVAEPFASPEASETVRTRVPRSAPERARSRSEPARGIAENAAGPARSVDGARRVVSSPPVKTADTASSGTPPSRVNAWDPSNFGGRH